MKLADTSFYSFIYNKRNSIEFINTWEPTVDIKKIDKQRKLHNSYYVDFETNLYINCETIEYLDFPAIEWVIKFENKGDIDTHILENILPLDIELQRKQKDGEFVLHHCLGSQANRADFSPMENWLASSSLKRLQSINGRSSDGGDFPPDDYGSLPFFNLEFDNGGIIFAIGWTGSWFAEFKRDNGHGISVKAGMPGTHLKLFPGEEIRTPRILMFFWDGEIAEAHNKFRTFILKHHTPHIENMPVELPLAANTWVLHNSGNDVTEQNQIECINKYANNKIKLDHFWLDAGWYEGVGDWAYDVGNWMPKKRSFPNGLMPVSQMAKENDMGFVLWFEPERVRPGTEIFNEHPEFLIMPDEKMIEKQLKMAPQVNALLNLGNPKALEWITNRISSLIKENGVTVYRQDFNMDVAGYWRANDAYDRQGMSEIKHIQGLYQLWDTLLERHPGLIIDNCATGGKRIDLETISRSVVLWRSDWVFACEPEGSQSHTLGINLYCPCTGGATNSTDPYVFRSNLAAGLCLSWNVYSKDFDFIQARKRIEEYKILRPFFYKDFYPLTVHQAGRISDVWCAYQLNDKDKGKGAIVAFRRAKSPYSQATFKLRGLDENVKYEIENLDTAVKQICDGKYMMKTGINIEMFDAPEATILLYENV